MNKFVKTALAGLVMSLGLAASARADVLFLDSGMMDHARVVHIAGIGDVLDAPIQFKASENGKQVSLLAWCVDVYHEITLKDYTPDLQYVDTGALSTDFAGHPLDHSDPYKIGLLANYGQFLFDNAPKAPAPFTQVAPKRSDFPAGAAGTAAFNAAKTAYNNAKTAHNQAVAAYNAAVANRYTQLSAVQGAIWQVASNRNVTSKDAAFDLLVDHLSADPRAYFGFGYTANDYGVKLITPVQTYGGRNGKTPLPLTQSFVYATGAVPEPGTWALMITGFGLMGAALRRRRAFVAA